ncbi:hypothetical protein PsYK624_153420 [Phanerochaete sordida]|uniref:Uncharacterized protein n=1 Tax=Phanerochaete sordida TaxID=48140 RepID=A0A9P3GQ31_9APHY|nr:hypothetical protein PsYK624_153420 [Phanerochaete sordida]
MVQVLGSQGFASRGGILRPFAPTSSLKTMYSYGMSSPPKLRHTPNSMLLRGSKFRLCESLDGATQKRLHACHMSNFKVEAGHARLAQRSSLPLALSCRAPSPCLSSRPSHAPAHAALPSPYRSFPGRLSSGSVRLRSPFLLANFIPLALNLLYALGRPDHSNARAACRQLGLCARPVFLAALAPAQSPSPLALCSIPVGPTSTSSSKHERHELLLRGFRTLAVELMRIVRSIEHLLPIPPPISRMSFTLSPRPHCAVLNKTNIGCRAEPCAARAWLATALLRQPCSVQRRRRTL